MTQKEEKEKRTLTQLLMSFSFAFCIYTSHELNAQNKVKKENNDQSGR